MAGGGSGSGEEIVTHDNPVSGGVSLDQWGYPANYSLRKYVKKGDDNGGHVEFLVNGQWVGGNGLPWSPNGNHSNSPTPSPQPTPIGGGPQTPTVNLNNIAPTTLQQSSPNPNALMPSAPSMPNPLQPPMQQGQGVPAQGIPVSGQADGMSFAQAYSPISNSMNQQRDADFNRWMAQQQTGN